MGERIHRLQFFTIFSFEEETGMQGRRGCGCPQRVGDGSSRNRRNRRNDHTRWRLFPATDIQGTAL